MVNFSEGWGLKLLNVLPVPHLKRGVPESNDKRKVRLKGLIVLFELGCYLGCGSSLLEVYTFKANQSLASLCNFLSQFVSVYVT
jgi:hypothetical protein